MGACGSRVEEGSWGEGAVEMKRLKLQEGKEQS